MHVIWILLRRSVYFLNICFIRVFYRFNRNRALQIGQVEEDKLIWKAEKNGVYSVKNSYDLCVEDLVDTSHLR
jgi:hypothetical protein